MIDLQEKLKESFASFARVMADEAQAARELQPLAAELDPDQVSLSIGGTSYLSATGDEEKLKELFKLLRKHGWEPEKRPGDEKMTEFATYFKHPDYKTWIYFAFYSSVCRKVKVGTAMVEQDVYEIQCGEAEAH